MKTYNVLGVNDELIGKCSLQQKKILNEYFLQIQSKLDYPIKNEFFEILDSKTKEKSGFIKPRDLVHRDGNWHGAIHFHIYCKENNKTSLVFQIRNSNKDTFPRMIDTAAAGHYLPGEELQDGLREVEEEIGLKIELQNVINLGKHRFYFFQEEKNIKNCEVQDVLLFQSNFPINKYKLQKEELHGIIKINTDDIIRLFKMECNVIDCEEAYIFDETDNLVKRELSITRNDFVPCIYDHYFLKTAFITKMISNNMHVVENPYDYDVLTYF
ncbi:MAG TPA: NUDIX domain-containing protein [Bacteroidales bacterium]|nr:NUDIX domain-containing protein [Bacteroidales bacterium]